MTWYFYCYLTTGLNPWILVQVPLPTTGMKQHHSGNLNPFKSVTGTHCRSLRAVLKGARFSQALSHFCTLAGAGALQPPVCWSTDHSTTSATVSSLPTSHGLLPRAEFMERSTAALSLLPPSLNCRTAASTQLSFQKTVKNTQQQESFHMFSLGSPPAEIP